MEQCPESLQDRDTGGRVLLHYQLDLGNSQFPLVRLVVRTWPGAVSVRDRRGRLPLHLAVVTDAPLNVVYLLVRERPDLLPAPTGGRAWVRKRKMTA